MNPTRNSLLIAAAAAALLAGCGRQDQEIMADPPAAGVAPAAALQSPADAAITADIQAKFAADAELSPLAIRVRTHDGLVELDGKAPDAKVRDHATRVAAKAKNVLSVDNHMAVPRS
ncbi:MAG TPA: BON domain-containing protein [Roseateles sp.]|nr:BON domain-containing protein [Roseateles sp.]